VAPNFLYAFHAQLRNWDNPLIANGRRCPECAAYVERMRPRAFGGA
jgi:hypothetical protein